MERASAKHDHEDEHADPDRKYGIYNYKMDDTIQEAINDGLSFQHVKKKLWLKISKVPKDWGDFIKKFIGKHVFCGKPMFFNEIAAVSAAFLTKSRL